MIIDDRCQNSRKYGQLAQCITSTQCLVFIQKNRAMSEVESQGSRHRRRSVPSFASSLLGGAGRGAREGSVDPLLEGFQSDGGDSQGTRHSHSTFHRSVSRGDLDAMDRWVAHSSYTRAYTEF